MVRSVAGGEIWGDDVTGDGLGDLLICRQNFTPGTGREGAGALTIVVGGNALREYAAGLAYLDLRDPPSAITVVTFFGVSAYDRLGIWTRTGDVTGDGMDEPNRGAVYVIRGGEHLNMSQTVDLADFGATALVGNLARMHPPEGSTSYHFGATCQIADLDGNGRSEVLVAAALARSGAGIRLPGAPSGTGMSFGGSTDGTLFIAWDDNFPEGAWPAGYEFTITEPSMGESSVIGGSNANSEFAEDIVGGLDYDGDGSPDLFLGDLIGNGGNGTNSGLGYLIFDAGSLKGLNFDFDEPPEEIRFSVVAGPTAGSIGTDTTAQGDFNGDGLADLLIGNPKDDPQGRNNAGTMHVLFGQNKEWPEVIDLASARLPPPSTLRITQIDGANGRAGSDSGDIICYSAAAGDIDGDGRVDIIVNEMEGNGLSPGTVDVGNLLLISGAALPVSELPELSFSPAAIEFPSIEVSGGSTSPETVTLAYSGSETISGISIAPEGSSNFSITSDSGETELEPGESRVIMVSFNPSTSGLKTANLTQSNALGVETEGVMLSGSGFQSSEAEDDDASTDINTPVTIDVLGNDSDPDGDSLSVRLSIPPDRGTAKVNVDDTIDYTPEEGFIGMDSFKYRIRDGTGGSDSATVTVLVEYPLVPGGSARLVNDGTEFQGNTYNGFEMVGSSAMFSSVAGEITRLSFLDPDGDLVFAEFGSEDPATTLTIELGDAELERDSPYDQPTVKYAQGLASFAIENSTAITFFSVFTTGNDSARVDLTLINEDTFSGSADGIADISGIVIAVPEGETREIGGINAANTNFEGDDAAIGIFADRVVFRQFLFVGDITPSGTSAPAIRIDPDSSLTAILINGGDLAEATGSLQIDTAGAVYPFPILATDGRRSITDSPLRPDLGDGVLPPVAVTFVADVDAYFITDGQNAGLKESMGSD